MWRTLKVCLLFIPAFLAGQACSSSAPWGAGGTPDPDGSWRTDMPAILAEPAHRAALAELDDAKKKAFMKYLRTMRLDIRGNRLRGGTAAAPGKWQHFRIVDSGPGFLVVRYRRNEKFSPANVRLSFPRANRLRFKEVGNKQSPPLYFKK